MLHKDSRPVRQGEKIYPTVDKLQALYEMLFMGLEA